MRCTSCTHDGTRCSNHVNIVLRNIPKKIQKDLHGVLVHRCNDKTVCCQICTTHAKEAFRFKYGPMLMEKGVDVANMAFTTMMEMMTCKMFELDSSTCEEFHSGSQGVADRWGFSSLG